MRCFAVLTRTAMSRLAPGEALRFIVRPSAPHEAEKDALANAAIGDAQLADRPEPADRVENGAAGENEIGPLPPMQGWRARSSWD